MEVHSQSTVSAQMVTPSDGTDSLIEVRIIASRERLHTEEHSAGQPGPQTYPVSSTQIPGASNTCPGRRDLLGSQVPQFVRQHVFHGQRSAREQLCLLYTSPSPRDGLLSRM